MLKGKLLLMHLLNLFKYELDPFFIDHLKYDDSVNIINELSIT